jgi:hypothetical protein
MSTPGYTKTWAPGWRAKPYKALKVPIRTLRALQSYSWLLLLLLLPLLLSIIESRGIWQSETLDKLRLSDNKNRQRSIKKQMSICTPPHLLLFCHLLSSETLGLLRLNDRKSRQRSIKKQLSLRTLPHLLLFCQTLGLLRLNDRKSRNRRSAFMQQVLQQLHSSIAKLATTRSRSIS